MKERPIEINIPPSELYPLVQPLLYASAVMLPEESTFWTMGFDKKDRLLFMERLVTIRPIHLVPSTVFTTAVNTDAARLVLCQQPAGQILEPTAVDKELVRRVWHIGSMLDLPLIDHLMINAREYRSFQQEGWMDQFRTEGNPKHTDPSWLKSIRNIKP